MSDLPINVFHIPLHWDPAGLQWAQILTYIQNHNLDVGENLNRRELSIFDQTTLLQLSDYCNRHSIRVIRCAQGCEE